MMHGLANLKYLYVLLLPVSFAETQSGRKDGQERGRVAGSVHTHLKASSSEFFSPTMVKFIDVACMPACVMEVLSMNSGSRTGTPNFRSPKM